MYLADEVEKYIAMMKSKDYYSDKYVIAAYPYVYSPTRLDRPLITVSPCGIDANRAGIGADEFFAKYKIRIDVFVPQNGTSPCVSDIIGTILDDAAEFYPLAYSVSEITADDSISCFTACVKLTHSGLIQQEDNNESGRTENRD
ncbi:MAG: hypothetical protein IJ235_06605 [Eubacterium sp.]|nr:hypothetical protein [Eubacterium sp.]MBQ8980862.1 hypothetical protein [Eubacterium sp.]MBR1531581.1 hypothetical protein [Eubacterium sp.]MBR2278152.1 hypothetical protein [Eubacterium sp.]